MLFHFMMIYIRAKRRTNGDKIQTNFHSLNVPEDGVGYESFTIISIDYLVIFENKYYIIVTRNNIVWKLLFILLKDFFVSATLCRVHNFFFTEECCTLFVPTKIKQHSRSKKKYQYRKTLLSMIDFV